MAFSCLRLDELGKNNNNFGWQPHFRGGANNGNIFGGGYFASNKLPQKNSLLRNNKHDLFVYMNPQKASVSANLTLDRPTKKLISSSTSNLNENLTKTSNISHLLKLGDETSNYSKKSRSMSIQQLNNTTNNNNNNPLNELSSYTNQYLIGWTPTNIQSTKNLLVEEETIDCASTNNNNDDDGGFITPQEFDIDEIDSSTLQQQQLANNLNTLPKFPRSIDDDIENQNNKSLTTSQINSQLISCCSSTKEEQSSNKISHNNNNNHNSNGVGVGGGPATTTLADKLSKSFFDLTHGSQERLQKWKTKLQQYGHKQLKERCIGGTGTGTTKHIGEPPISRKMCSFGGTVPATSEMEILVDWTISNNNNNNNNSNEYSSPTQLAYAPTRPLRSSRSTSNAFSQCLTTRHGAISPTTKFQPIKMLKNDNEKNSTNANVCSSRILLNLKENAKSQKNLTSGNLMMAQSEENFKANSIHKSSSLREPYSIRSAAVTANVNINSNCTSSSSPSSSPPPPSNNSNNMEHRTLKVIPSNTFNNTKNSTHNQKISINKTLSVAQQNINNNLSSQCQENNVKKVELPPPARILPYSGIKPQDNAIIRPIAFRPINLNSKTGADVLEHRQSIELSSIAFCKNGVSAVVNSRNRLPYALENSGGASSMAQLNKTNLKDHSRSIGNLVLASIAPNRPGNNNINGYRPDSMHQFNRQSNFSCTASSSQLYANSGTAAISTVPAKPINNLQHQKTNNNNIQSLAQTSLDENDYDTVPEYIDQERYVGTADEAYSLVYNTTLPPHTSNGIPSSTSSSSVTSNRRVKNTTTSTGHVRKAVASLYQQQQQQQNSLNTHHNTLSSSNSSGSNHITGGQNGNGSSVTYSPPNSAGLIKKSISNHHQTGNRSSSGGLHITPSPSDSGIVDYEMLIRDKENELSSVRHAMEQNEGVLIRVYQDKERQFSAELQTIRQKLAASQQSESALRHQLQNSDEIRQQLQKSIQMLTEDRNIQQRKCLKLENELNLLKIKVDGSNKCGKCSHQNHQNGSFYENNFLNYNNNNNNNILSENESEKKPIPAPRIHKDSNSTTSSMNNGGDSQLRTEVDELRNEISGLRDQIRLFSNNAQNSNNTTSSMDNRNSVETTTSQNSNNNNHFNNTPNSQQQQQNYNTTSNYNGTNFTKRYSQHLSSAAPLLSADRLI